MKVKRSLAKSAGSAALAAGATYLGSRYLPVKLRQQIQSSAKALPQKLSPAARRALLALSSPATWRRLRKNGLRGAGKSLLVLAGQAAASRAWSWLFFERQGARGRVPGAIRLLSNVATMSYLLYRRSRIAGGLVLPSATWILLISLLNGPIWRMNR